MPYHLPIADKPFVRPCLRLLGKGMAERKPRAISYLILPFGAIRHCSTNVETDEKRIMSIITRRAVDNRLDSSSSRRYPQVRAYLRHVNFFTAGLCSMRLKLQAELGLNAFDAKSAKRVRRENRGASPLA